MPGALFSIPSLWGAHAARVRARAARPRALFGRQSGLEFEIIRVLEFSAGRENSTRAACAPQTCPAASNSGSVRSSVILIGSDRAALASRESISGRRNPCSAPRDGLSASRGRCPGWNADGSGSRGRISGALQGPLGSVTKSSRRRAEAARRCDNDLSGSSGDRSASRADLSVLRQGPLGLARTLPGFAGRALGDTGMPENFAKKR